MRHNKGNRYGKRKPDGTLALPRSPRVRSSAGIDRFSVLYSLGSMMRWVGR